MTGNQNLRREGPYIEGTEVTLTCASRDGNPRPAITWRRNGVEMTEARLELNNDAESRETKSVLTHRFTREDDGAEFRYE